MTDISLSIVVPVLNEAALLEASLLRLVPLRQGGTEVIVVDGGSTDDTVRLAEGHCDLVLRVPRGRARQMNAGARAARGQALLFLHVDTQLPEHAPALVASGLEEHPWGRFDISISGRSPLLRLVSRLVNLRSRLTGIATGDQAIFVRSETFSTLGGYLEIPLMEDIELTTRLKRAGPPACLRQKVLTSGRRWESQGVLRTILKMWRLRAAFWLGSDPAQLARDYGYEPDGR